MFVPFLIFPIIYFAPDEHQERQQAAREHEKSLDADNGPAHSPVAPTYRKKTEDQNSLQEDEEAKYGFEDEAVEEGHFAIEEYIPGL